MSDEKCKECNRVLVLDEENLCAYCELTQDNTLDVSCGICQVIVEEESEGLFCDVCKSWFHNNCNKTPLHYELYALMNEAPKNIVWFCDKCIWETEKWIKEMNNKCLQAQDKFVKVKKRIHKPNGERGKEDEEIIKVEDEEDGNDEDSEGIEVTNYGGNDEDSDSIHEEGSEDEERNGDRGLSKSDTKENEKVIKLNQQKKRKRNKMEIEKVESVIIEEKEEVIKIKQKMKWKNIKIKFDKDSGSTKEKKEVVKIKQKKKTKKIKPKEISTESDNTETANMSNILDISSEHLSNIKDGIIPVKQKMGRNVKSKCNLCPKSFLYLVDCIAHKLKDHEGVEKPYKCPVCNNTFYHKDQRKKHLKRHSGDKVSCDICGRVLKSAVTLHNHILYAHSEDKIQSCNKCDYKTNSRKKLVNHRYQVHCVQKPFPCELCDKRFITAARRQKHLDFRHTEKTFKCSKCDKIFGSKKVLTHHIKSHIPNDERAFPCDHCDKRFHCASSLKRHKDLNVGEYKVICGICGKRFRNVNYVKRHAMIHTDERPFKCEICGKAFRTLGTLNVHIPLHSAEYPFECDVCGFKSKTKSNLNKHKTRPGSCKGPNISGLSVKGKRKSKTPSERHEMKECDPEDSSIHFQGTNMATGNMATGNMAAAGNMATGHMNTMQVHGHPSLLLNTNSHSNAYSSQYYDSSLIPPNSRGITATVPSLTSINY